jgi:hypothetical protein
MEKSSAGQSENCEVLCGWLNRNLNWRNLKYKKKNPATLRFIVKFYVLLTVQHLGTIFVNNQLHALFFFTHVYFYSPHVPSKPAHQTVIYTEWHIPDVILIQLILLMMSTWLPETCREWRQSHPNLHTKRSSIESDIYQMSYWYN